MLDILLVAAWIIVASAGVAAVSAAPWVPAKPKEIQNLFNHLSLKGTETIYDLGCGTGSVLFALAARYPNAKAVGYDISLLPLMVGWMRKVLCWRRYRNVHLHFGNLFTADVAHADVIVLFLMERAYGKLLPALRATIRDDARVALEGWPFPDITPLAHITTPECLPVYIYQGKQLKT